MGISLLLSLVVMEIILRHYRRFKTYDEIAHLKGKPYLADYSPYLPFTLPKNVSFRHRNREFNIVYRINKHGYRGKFPQSINKPPHQKRILICGDSFTLGWGNKLKETFVQQIQDFLSSEKYSVINAAYHAGYSPDSYYAYLVKEGIKLNPDIVIFVLYTGNDVTDMLDNEWLETDETSYTWTSEANFEIRVMTIDEHGGESDWSDPFEFSTPRSKAINLLTLLIRRLIERFPLLELYIN